MRDGKPRSDSYAERQGESTMNKNNDKEFIGACRQSFFAEIPHRVGHACSAHRKPGAGFRILDFGGLAWSW